MTMNAPENRDTDFSWREFIYSHNSELLGGYGNLVNRTFKFIQKYYGSQVPQDTIQPEIQAEIKKVYQTVGKQKLVRFTNKYFDEQKPWKRIEEDKLACDKTIFNCTIVIVNLAQLLAPFLPFTSSELNKMLGQEELSWEFIHATPTTIGDVKPLFERIDVKTIEEEVEKLNGQVN